VGSLPFWQKRFAELDVTTEPVVTRFADQVLTFFDPDGLRLELVATAEADSRAPAPSAVVPAEFAIRGFHSSTLGLINAKTTAGVLVNTMGYRKVAEEGARTRYTVAT